MASTRASPVIVPILLAASVHAAVTYPDTIAGKRAKAYVEAFNSGDEAVMKAFFLEHASKRSLQQRPVEARLSVYRQIKADVGSLAPEKVLRESVDSISLLARTTRGWVTVEVHLEAEGPHGIDGIGIEESSGPDEAVTPKRGTADLVTALEGWLGDLARRDEMSGVVLVAKDGKPLFQKAYGLASREYQVPNTTDTRFCLGSISKIFTKVAILQLAADGELSLDDPLGKHLPDYPNADAARKVTVRQLLDMSSGIGDFFGDAYDATPKSRIRTLQDYLPFFAKEPPAFEPGTDRRYSNGGYLALGLIVEALAGRSYYEQVRTRLFEPAGMKNSAWIESDEVAPSVAMGYTREHCPEAQPGCPRRTNIHSRPGRGSSAGGSYSPAADLLAFVGALEKGKLLPPDATAELLRGGLGIAGGAPGMNATVDTGVGGGYTVIVLCNDDPPMAENVARRIRSWAPRER